MPPPTADEVRVATDALRADARVWSAQSDQLKAICTKVTGLHMTRLEAGVFQVVLSAYDNMVGQVAARCQEGHDRMQDIDTTLRRVADTYETEDGDNEHRILNLY